MPFVEQLGAHVWVGGASFWIVRKLERLALGIARRVRIGRPAGAVRALVDLAVRDRHGRADCEGERHLRGTAKQKSAHVLVSPNPGPEARSSLIVVHSAPHRRQPWLLFAWHARGPVVMLELDESCNPQVAP